ncbi:hypothetical protein H2199_001459 [Coniosporium tulheliwenetii]|uniref:Uncharacterized protein n=1 Tax=Coniosporium tulheliwenetii TaxID=3383036 RepID=A0ACC2ZM38_9PEZI|nr:hypothetical protein H2199_001459 [Cladosporium sp. JES 115]
MKRKAPDTVDSDQRLTKRFHLLNLAQWHTLHPLSASAQHPRPPPKPQPPDFDPDFMQVEDTKDKIYIYDLDKELAELESDDEAPIFLRDVDKQLYQIPKHVLAGPPQEPRNTELVLYKVPESLSVPREQDSVRKAIIEARARARERQGMGMEVPHLPDAEPYMVDGIHGELANGRNSRGVDGNSSDATKEDRGQEAEEDDPDAMDLG